MHGTSVAPSTPLPEPGPGESIPLDHIVSVDPSPLLPDTFIGAGGDYGLLGVYGGHLLGQALAAAFGTVPVDSSDHKVAHALHGHFLKSGQPATPIAYQVERLRDGRNYATRLVRATQGGQLLMILSASFKTPEPGDQHQPEMGDVRPVASLLARRQRKGLPPLQLPFTGIGGVEIEPVGDWHPMDEAGAAPALAMWMRCALAADAEAADDGVAGDRRRARARQCALAYLSDGTLMFNSLRPHGQAFSSHRATSLDHAVWFHQPADPSAWLLFDQNGPVAGDGRGLNQGRIFDADGRLLASVAQESMMRRVR